MITIPISSLTIAIITHNRPLSLDKCLKNLTNQLPENITIKMIIIDNQPQSETKKNISKYSSIKNIFITYHPQKSNSIPLARNLAIKLCTTPFLAFIDDDCLPDKNWLTIALSSIETNKKYAFIIGDNRLQNPNYLTNTQYAIYKQWFDLHVSNNMTFDPAGLDTKNIIFNLKKINNFKFDQKFDIFEDTDFGLQLKQNNLYGFYEPKLIALHPEISNLTQVIKKNYRRGKFKYLIEQKWGNFDNFNSTIILKSFLNTNLLKSLLHFIFQQGYLHQQSKAPLITIVNNLNQHNANYERSVIIHHFLIKNHFQVNLLNSEKLFNETINNPLTPFSFPSAFFQYRLFRFLKFTCKLPFGQQFIRSEFQLRGQIIKKHLQNIKANIAIIQCSEDIGCIPSKQYKSIYDSPTIFSLEKNSKTIRNIEAKAFTKSDFVSFHWYSFLALAKKRGYKISHPFVLNWGCNPPIKDYSTTTGRQNIIYLGNVNSPWINPSLLKNLFSTSETPVDIYSYEKSQNRKIKTKGFLKDLSKLTKYKFGLITITNDELRNHGFSAKHLLYLSYGLPVLCPEWRKDKLLSSATIYYNESNFNRIVSKYSKPEKWQKKHQAALRLSQKLYWDKNLKPLILIINSLLKK